MLHVGLDRLLPLPGSRAKPRSQRAASAEGAPGVSLELRGVSGFKGGSGLVLPLLRTSAWKCVGNPIKARTLSIDSYEDAKGVCNDCGSGFRVHVVKDGEVLKCAANFRAFLKLQFTMKLPKGLSAGLVSPLWLVGTEVLDPVLSHLLRWL